MCLSSGSYAKTCHGKSSVSCMLICGKVAFRELVLIESLSLMKSSGLTICARNRDKCFDLVESRSTLGEGLLEYCRYQHRVLLFVFSYIQPTNHPIPFPAIQSEGCYRAVRHIYLRTSPLHTSGCSNQTSCSSTPRPEGSAPLAFQRSYATSIPESSHSRHREEVFGVTNYGNARSLLWGE